MGWLRINGDSVRDGAGQLVEDDPPLLGVFMQCVRQDFCAGTVLHYAGTQDNAILE